MITENINVWSPQILLQAGESAASCMHCRKEIWKQRMQKKNVLGS